MTLQANELMAGRVAAVRAAVQDAAQCLGTSVYQEAKELFLACAARPEYLAELRRLAPQFGRAEFLLPVDAQGMAAPANVEVLRDVPSTLAARPEFEAWFQVANMSGPPGSASTATLAGQGEPASPSPAFVLVSRWLCHLAGLRHRTVEIFIDHPVDGQFTLVQIRSPAKLEYPGCFDLPTAGHVVGLASLEESFYKELHEELALGTDDLEAVQRLGSYVSDETSYGGARRDVEQRTVFASRLKPGRLEKIRFLDGEVAGVAFFKVSEIEALLSKYPERVASGLAQSLPLYHAAHLATGSFQGR